MKKWLLTIALVSCLVLLQGCLDFDNESNGGNGTRIERTTILPEGQTEEFNEDDYINGYYPTIEEAIKNNNYLDGKPADFKWASTIKIIENQENGVFFGTVIFDGEEEFAVIRVKVKEVNGKKNFSNPLSYGPLPVGFINMYKNKGIVREQEMSLELFSSFYAIEKLKNYPNFKWSLSAKKEVKKIRVNNQKPTEIIPFKIGKDQLYFYYFEDLPTKDSEELKITAD